MALMESLSELSLLHSMRLSGHAPIERITTRLEVHTGVHVDIAVVRTHLDAAKAEGWVQERSGAYAGWSLTAEGRQRGEALLAAELDARGARALVEERYVAFVEINGGFLEICTDWQLRPTGDGTPVLNDHSDPDWDNDVLARLRIMHSAVVEIVEPIGTVVERFGGYAPRFSAALGRIEAGDHDWFTRPLIDSYHTVWFELHEDLLGTLNRQRSQER